MSKVLRLLERSITLHGFYYLPLRVTVFAIDGRMKFYYDITCKRVYRSGCNYDSV